MTDQLEGRELDRAEIPGGMGYYADRLGNIWSSRAMSRNKSLPPFFKMKQGVDACGYKVVSLSGGICVRVHRLVIEAFHGPMPGQGYQTRHLDGDKLNNRPSNLRWGTAADNGRDAARHGTAAAGERHGGSKLTAIQVREIRRRATRGEPHRVIAEDYPVHQATISKIVRGAIWSRLVVAVAEAEGGGDGE